MDSLGELIPDKYELNARLRPALLLLLPAIAVAAVWIPELRTMGGAILTLAVTCGVTYFLSQVARRRGRALEDSWGDAIGRRHSARLLRHDDDTIRASVKQRVVDLVSEFGPGFPSPADEAADSNAAEDRRIDAVEWLLEVTRADAQASLLLGENIAYGFSRNLRGLKPIGLPVAIIALGIDAWLLFQTGAAGDNRAGIAAGFFCLIFILVWLFQVTRRQVEQYSLIYAQRLFAQADNPALRARLAEGRVPLPSKKQKGK